MIGRVALLLLLACGGTAAPAFADVLRHHAEVELTPDRGLLKATDRITGLAQRTITFRLASGLEVRSVHIDERVVVAERAGDVWRIEAKIEPGQELSIDYAGRLSQQPSIAPFLGPDGGFLPSETAWLPDLDADRVTFDVAVRTPEPHVAVVTGDLVKEAHTDGIYLGRFQATEPGEGPTLFTGPYVVDEHDAAGAKIRTYFYPEQANLAAEYLQQTARYLQRFNRRIGSYPYRDFYVVAAPVPVGLGFPRATYVAGQILHLPFMQGRSLAHEVLHSWWGNAVAVNYARGNWAEGLTTYMADYALEAEEGASAAREMRLGWLRDFEALPADRDTSLRDFVSREHAGAQVVGYNKAAFVFHMLHRRLGEAKFNQAIQRFWQDFRFRRASWADLEGAFSSTLGEDLDSFFSQWIDRPGAPRLEFADVRTRTSADGHEVIVRIGQDVPHYALEVPIEVETENGSERFVVDVDEMITEVALAPRSAPRAVTLDPDYDVFRHLAPGEASPILRDVTLGAEVSLSIVPDSAEFAQVASELAERMVDGSVELVAEGGQQPERMPALVIGRTGEVQTFLRRLRLAKTPASLDGRGTARAWVARTDEATPLLVVEADDEGALEALLRPLPHYGRTSYVIFEGSQAVAQGVWSPGNNPLRRTLR